MGFRDDGRFISKYNVTTGMIIDFSYTTTSSKKNKTARYKVLVIDPEKFHDSTDNGQLHGLLIDDSLSDLDIVRIATEIGQEFNYNPNPETPKDRRVPITMLQTNEAYTRYTTSFIKNDRRYRTFLVDNMSSVRQILIGKLK